MSTVDGQPLILFQPETEAKDRACGDCTLCCKLVPVKAIQKPRDEWCPHCDKKAGCTIYAERPEECMLWSCIWLSDANQPEALKPRRTHCVFDRLIDHVRISGEDLPVFQLWVDTAYPTAFRKPALLKEIDRLGKLYGCATLARIGYKGILIVPPSISKREQFIEIEAPLTPPETWGEPEDWQLRAYEQRYGKSP